MSSPCCSPCTVVVLAASSIERQHPRVVGLALRCSTAAMPTTTSTFCQGNMSHQTKGFLVLFCWLLQLLEDLFCFAVQFSHVQWTALSCAPILAVRKRLLQGLERVCSTACVRRTRKSSCNKERASTKKIALKCSVISSSLRARFVSSSPPLLSSSSPPPPLPPSSPPSSLVRKSRTSGGEGGVCKRAAMIWVGFQSRFSQAMPPMFFHRVGAEIYMTH